MIYAGLASKQGLLPRVLAIVAAFAAAHNAKQPLGYDLGKWGSPADL